MQRVLQGVSSPIGSERTRFNGHFQALLCIRYQFSGVFVNVAHQISRVHITVETIKVAGHIDVDNVAIFKNVLIGDSMANNLVYRPSNVN